MSCSKQNTLDDSATSVSGRVIEGKHVVRGAVVRAYGAPRPFGFRATEAVGSPSFQEIQTLLDTTTTGEDGTYTLSVGSYVGPVRVVAAQGSFPDGTPNSVELSALVLSSASNGSNRLVPAHVNNLTTLAVSLFTSRYGPSQPVGPETLGPVENAASQLFHLGVVQSLTEIDVKSEDDDELGYAPHANDQASSPPSQKLEVITTALSSAAQTGYTPDKIAADASSGTLTDSAASQLSSNVQDATTQIGAPDGTVNSSVSKTIAFVGSLSVTQGPTYSLAQDSSLGVSVRFSASSAVSYAVQLSEGTCASTGGALVQAATVAAPTDGSDAVFGIDSGLTAGASYCLSISAQDSGGNFGDPLPTDLTATNP